MDHGRIPYPNIDQEIRDTISQQVTVRIPATYL